MAVLARVRAVVSKESLSIQRVGRGAVLLLLAAVLISNLCCFYRGFVVRIITFLPLDRQLQETQLAPNTVHTTTALVPIYSYTARPVCVRPTMHWPRRRGRAPPGPSWGSLVPLGCRRPAEILAEHARLASGLVPSPTKHPDRLARSFPAKHTPAASTRSMRSTHTRSLLSRG